MGVYILVLSKICSYLRLMKLSAWAKTSSSLYQTAWRMWHNGKPVLRAAQLPTGTLIPAPHKVSMAELVAICARLSGADQKADLDGQFGRRTACVSHERLMVGRSVSAIGSGQNGHQAKIMRLPASNGGMYENRRTGCAAASAAG